MKQLGKDRRVLQLTATGWTDAERGRADAYAPVEVAVLHQSAKDFTPGERVAVHAVEHGEMLVSPLCYWGWPGPALLGSDSA